jgi:hypothetical protein
MRGYCFHLYASPIHFLVIAFMTGGGLQDVIAISS